MVGPDVTSKMIHRLNVRFMLRVIRIGIISVCMTNAATAAAHFEIDATPIATCGRDLCFACCLGVCADAKAAEFAAVAADAPALAPLSDDALVAICDALDADTLTLSEAA